jgi:hypothetical protein
MEAVRLVESTDYFGALTRYSRQVADTVGLRDFEIEVDHHPCPEDRLALVYVTPERRHLRLMVCRNFAALPADAQRYALVHECIHGVLGRMCVLVEEMSVGWMPPMTARHFRALWEREVEEATHVLASVVAATVPIPEFAR